MKVLWHSHVIIVMLSLIIILSLEGLAYIMNELFGGVVYAGIDTDKHRYPIGEQLIFHSIKNNVDLLQHGQLLSF